MLATKRPQVAQKRVRFLVLSSFNASLTFILSQSSNKPASLRSAGTGKGKRFLYKATLKTLLLPGTAYVALYFTEGGGLQNT